MSQMEEVCQLAQNLARNLGYHVFPCHDVPNDPKIDKTPATPRGFQDACNEPSAIANLWRRYPGGLIGIATGAVSDVDVLDVDSYRHKEAGAWWTVASKRISATRLYRTRSGGLHAYFQHADGVRNTQSKLANGVDTRGDGGYAICWFATGCDCEDHSPPAPWPAWLLECVCWKAEPVIVPAIYTNNPSHAGAAIDGVLRTIAEAPEGRRNAVLYWGAHRLGERIKAGQISQAEASGLLIAAAQSVGLPAVEAQRTVASAWRAA